MRVGFIDWLRLLASLSMIQGHAIDAVLLDEARVGPLHESWSWARGLTAPAFLVASGLSFHLASRLDDDVAYAARRATHGARARRVARAVWLVALGTLLHAFDAPWVIDVLQCVGVSLLVLDGLVTLSDRRDHVLAAAGALAVLSVAFALPASDLSGTGALRYLTSWVSRQDGSLFPLLPWAGYVLAGVVVGRVALPEGARTAPATTSSRLLGLAFVAGVASVVLGAVLRPATEATWSAHPAIVCMRLALVLGIGGVLVLPSARMELPRWLQTLAGETLALYVVHLVVLYAAWVGPARIWPHALPLTPALALAAGLVVVSTAAALGWARAWPPIEARWMPWLARSRAKGEAR